MKIFQFFANFLDKKLENYPRITLALSKFFDVSSKITSMLLFNNVCFILFLMTCQLIILSEAGDLHLYVIKLHTVGIKGIYTGFHCLPFLSRCLIICFLMLSQVVIFNTTLSLCPKIQNYMFSLYGQEILKQRGYNSPGSSLGRLGLVCFGCATAYAGAEVSNRGAYSEELQAYNKSYKDYTDAAGPNVQPPTPPTYIPLPAKVSGLIKDVLTSQQ